MSDPRMDQRRFRPRAFRLDDRPEAAPDFVVEEKPDAYRIEAELQLDPAEQAVEKAQKQGFLGGGVFMILFGIYLEKKRRSLMRQFREPVN